MVCYILRADNRSNHIRVSYRKRVLFVWFQHKPKAFKDLQLVFPAIINRQHSFLFACHPQILRIDNSLSDNRLRNLHQFLLDLDAQEVLRTLSSMPEP